MDRLSHYELLEQLGAGGMGVVYKARDSRLGRFVAVKVLPPGKAADPERRQRFVTEARAASALAHPNVITVHEIGSDGGVDFMVTEFLPGRTLASLIPRSGLPVPEALRLAVPIADALGAAHAAGVIHRDLKPANVMVTDAGLVKVLDFGLARFVDPGPVAEGDETAAVVTLSGAVLGTCAYMSPEQAKGREVDPRTDVFSFGAVLYEMVTGRKAFARESPSATLAAVLESEPEPPSQVCSGVPAELERIILRCLRKDPARRFQSMADLKVALEELREESSAPARARSLLLRPRPALGLAAAVVLVAAAVGAWLVRREASSEEEPSRPVPLVSLGGRIASPTLSPDGNQVAFVWTGEENGTFDLYIKLVGPGAPVRLTNDPFPESSPAWSPDGRSIAFYRRLSPERAVLVVIPALGGDERVVAEAEEFHRGIAWSLDGRWLVVSGCVRCSPLARLGLLRVSLATGETTPLFPPANHPAKTYDTTPALSPDGRTLAFSRAASELDCTPYVVPVTRDLERAGEAVPLTAETFIAAELAWTPDGKRIVLSSGAGWNSSPALMVIPAAPAPGQQPRRVLGGEGGAGPSLSRTGSLVFARPMTDLNIWKLPLEAGRPGRPAPLVTSTRMDGEPIVSPDGKWMTFTSDRSGTTQLWLARADGSGQVQLTSMPAATTSAGRFSPDGRRIALVSNPEGQMDVYLTTPEGRQPQRLTTSPEHDTSPSWSHDGAFIYFASYREDGMQVWKMRADPRAAPVRVTRGGGIAPRESADGRTLYFVRWGGPCGSSIWQTPVAGGPETEVVSCLAFYWFYSVTASGLYYLTSAAPGGELRVHRFADGSDTLLLKLEKRSGFGLAAAPDDSYVLFTSYDLDATELMLVERFR